MKYKSSIKSMEASLRFLIALAPLLLMTTIAQADLQYSPLTLENNSTVLIIRGNFQDDDDLSLFVNSVTNHKPNFVTFSSGGGNIYKAMQLGKLIRLLQLNTIQMREMECSSACALSFLGGVERIAQPGSIGVHKSSFSDTSSMNVEDAVSSIQHATAETMSYISEMGADTNLLQLSLRYESDDMRYLSLKEMQNLKVVTSENNQPTTSTSPTIANPPPKNYEEAPKSQPLKKSLPSQDLSVPRVISGIVNHPKGKATIKYNPDNKSHTLSEVSNGMMVSLSPYNQQWYKAHNGSVFGFMHHSWVHVDQYATPLSSKRYIQIKSFQEYKDAFEYVEASPLLLDVYLSSNNWIAVTLKGSYDSDKALHLTKRLKKEHAIPSDAIFHLGNTYVRKLCCY